MIRYPVATTLLVVLVLLALSACSNPFAASTPTASPIVAPIASPAAAAGSVATQAASANLPSWATNLQQFTVADAQAAYADALKSGDPSAACWNDVATVLPMIQTAASSGGLLAFQVFRDAMRKLPALELDCPSLLNSIPGLPL